MSRRKNPSSDMDDKTVVADMNVEGMPWYDPEAKKRAGASAPDQPSLTRRQTFGLMLRGMGWGLLAGLIVAAVMILFILFLVKVW